MSKAKNIREFESFRTDQDGTYFYAFYDDDKESTWSYKLDDLSYYILQLQQENEKLKKENGLLEQNVNSTYETSQEMLAELSKENKQLKDTIDKVREEVEIQLEMFKGTDNTVMIAVFEKLSSILGDKDE